MYVNLKFSNSDKQPYRVYAMTIQETSRIGKNNGPIILDFLLHRRIAAAGHDNDRPVRREERLPILIAWQGDGAASVQLLVATAEVIISRGFRFFTVIFMTGIGLTKFLSRLRQVLAGLFFVLGSRSSILCFFFASCASFTSRRPASARALIFATVAASRNHLANLMKQADIVIGHGQMHAVLGPLLRRPDRRLHIGVEQGKGSEVFILDNFTLDVAAQGTGVIGRRLKGLFIPDKGLALILFLPIGVAQGA